MTEDRTPEPRIGADGAAVPNRSPRGGRLSNRRALIAIVFVGSIAFGWLGVGALIGVPPNQEEAVCARIIDAVGAAPRQEVVDLSSLTDFPWSVLVVFPPYETEAAARQALGFDWPAERLPSSSNDYWSSLIFSNGAHVVAWCSLDYRVNLLSPLPSGPLVVPIQRAQFVVGPVISGSTHLTLEGSG